MFQDTNTVDFDPALLPIQPSDVTVNVSYSIRSFDEDTYEANTNVKIVLDTPYNVRNVRDRRHNTNSGSRFVLSAIRDKG